MSFIELSSVYKKYKMGEVTINALDGVSFSVEQGELCMIVGPSGAGKTTVLNILGGIDSCDDGKVRVGGELINNFSEKRTALYRRHDVGFVFQFYNLIPTLTVQENVALVREISPDSFPAEKMLEEVGLLDHLRNFPSELSGGEQQRVSIARALAKNPEILLCDEPTGALDSETGVMVLKLLLKMARDYGKTIVIVTHNQNIARMADMVVRVKNGRIQSCVEPNEPAS